RRRIGLSLDQEIGLQEGREKLLRILIAALVVAAEGQRTLQQGRRLFLAVEQLSRTVLHEKALLDGQGKTVFLRLDEDERKAPDIAGHVGVGCPAASPPVDKKVHIPLKTKERQRHQRLRRSGEHDRVVPLREGKFRSVERDCVGVRGEG